MPSQLPTAKQGFSCLAKVGDPVVALWARCLHEAEGWKGWKGGGMDLRNGWLPIFLGTHFGGISFGDFF